jgi:hypothetical protein
MSSRSKNKKNNKRNNNQTLSARNHPPQIQSNIRLTHRYRFTSSNGSATNITGASIIGAMGSICNDLNTSVIPFFESFKIQELEIFAPPSAQGSTSTCSVEWQGTGNGPAIEVSDSSNSVSTPAHIRTGPPAMSQAAFWQTPAIVNNTLCTIVAPSGSIIDIVVSGILLDDWANANQLAVTTALLGHPYYLSLDPNATHYYTPVSLTTTN